MKIMISGPPMSGKTTLAKNLAERLNTSGRPVTLRDDNDGLALTLFGQGQPVEIHTVHRPGETVAQPGDAPAFCGFDVILAVRPGGHAGVLARDRTEAYLRCADPALLATLVLCVLDHAPARAEKPC